MICHYMLVCSFAKGYMVISIDGGIPIVWFVYFMEKKKHLEMDDFGVPPL